MNTSTAMMGTAFIAAALLAVTLVPAASGGAATGAVSEERGAPARTKVTFTVDDCEGCEIQLTSALGTIAEADAGEVDIWNSKTRTVRDGSVTFDIPTKRTWGMSVAVRAPWEGFTGYRTTVAWRYNGDLRRRHRHPRGGRDQDEGLRLLGGRAQPRGHRAPRRGEGPRATAEEEGRRQHRLRA